MRASFLQLFTGAKYMNDENTIRRFRNSMRLNVDLVRQIFTVGYSDCDIKICDAVLINLRINLTNGFLKRFK